MFGAIFNFIFRTIILNPMAMIGIVIGWYLMYRYGAENLQYVYTNPVVYAAIWGVSLLYALLFQHVYKPNTTQIDWWGTFVSSFNHAFNIVISVVLTCIIIYCLHYSFGSELDKYLRYNQGSPKLYINQ